MVNEKTSKKWHLFKKGKPDIFVCFCQKQLIFKKLYPQLKIFPKIYSFHIWKQIYLNIFNKILPSVCRMAFAFKIKWWMECLRFCHQYFSVYKQTSNKIIDPDDPWPFQNIYCDT